jgi:hypothetical protein
MIVKSVDAQTCQSFLGVTVMILPERYFYLTTISRSLFAYLPVEFLPLQV